MPRGPKDVQGPQAKGERDRGCERVEPQGWRAGALRGGGGPRVWRGPEGGGALRVEGP